MLVRYVCYKVWVTARVQLKNDQHLYPINADPHRHIRTTIQSIIKFISCIFPEFWTSTPKFCENCGSSNRDHSKYPMTLAFTAWILGYGTPTKGSCDGDGNLAAEMGGHWKSQGQCVSLNLILNAMLNALLSQWNIMFLGNVYAYCNMIYLNFQISTKAI